MSRTWFGCLSRAPRKSERDVAAQAPGEPAARRSERGDLTSVFDEKWHEPVERSLDASFTAPVLRLSEARTEGERDLDKLFIVTWNVQLLPGVLPGCAGSVRHLVARAEQIAERILDLEPWPDVVVLQEVWHPHARSELRCRLLCRYQHVHAPGRNSGLLILSRYQNLHLEHRFHKFEASQGVEGYAFRKGISATAIRLREKDDVQGKVKGIGYRVQPKTRCFLLFNAHTQSDFWRSGARTRAAQFEEAAEFIHETVENDAAMTTLSGPRDLLNWNAGAERVWAPTFPIGRWGYSPCDDSRCRYEPLEPLKRLDYVLDVTHTDLVKKAREMTQEENDFPPFEDGVSHARVLTRGLTQHRDGTPLSDHAPVLAMIAFT